MLQQAAVHPGQLAPALVNVLAAPDGRVLAPPGLDVVTWETHMSPLGVVYYHCQSTGESRWVRPLEPGHVVLEAPGQAAAPAGKAAAAEGVEAQIGKPESWETIGRTGWLRVETEHGFSYFFHKKTRRTSWQCPKDIERDVAELDGVLGVAGAAAATESAAPAEAAVAGEAQAATGPVAASSAAEARAERRERQVEEQRAAKEREALRNFKQLLLEKGVQAFDRYEAWLPKLLHDPRFTAVAGQAQRRALFEALVKRIDTQRRKQAASVKRGGRAAFQELLEKAKELGMFRDATAPHASKALQECFGNDQRWDLVPEAERDRLIAEAVRDIAREQQLRRDAARCGFRELVLGVLRGREDRPPPFHAVRPRLQEDVRWASVDSLAERERLYTEVAKELETAWRKRCRQRQRDEEEADTARKKRRLTEAEEGLSNLFAEHFKAPYALTWDTAREALGDCALLRSCSLHEEELARLWEEYKRDTIEARRQAFVQLLAHTSGDAIGPEMDFERVLGYVMSTPAAKAFGAVPEELLRAAWEEWRERAHEMAAEVCRKWLQSCEHLCGVADLEPAGPEFEALLVRLSGDVRLRRLAARPAEQRRLVAERLEELRRARGGPGALETRPAA